MGKECSTKGREEECIRILVGKAEGKRLLGIPRLRYVDNIKMDIIEIGWGDMDWIYLASNRDQWRAILNNVMNLRAPYNGG
jgi:hypothetical protein